MTVVAADRAAATVRWPRSGAARRTARASWLSAAKTASAEVIAPAPAVTLDFLVVRLDAEALAQVQTDGVPAPGRQCREDLAAEDGGIAAEPGAQVRARSGVGVP
jgi:hypothetical protein